MAGTASELQHPSFPTDPETFDQDDRISFSKISNTHILETEDGHEFEYDSQLSRWVAVLDEAEIEQQAKAYAVEGVDESAPAIDHSKKKRKQDPTVEDASGRLKKSKPEQQPRERKNTAVYVTNLPLDADIEEVESVFKRCGQIAENIDNDGPRIKLYTDEQDRFKGDALIMYFRAESVELAVQLLDDTDFRLGSTMPAGKMRVTVADYSYKKHTEAPSKSNQRDKKRIIKKTQKLNNRLADWDDDDPSALEQTSSRWDKVVILKHMFTLKELESDPAAMLDIKEDIREECAKLGEVTNVVLYDKEPDGVASVRFATPTAAEACVEVMAGRFFDGKHVVAYIATGAERFRKSNEKKADADSDDNDEGDDGNAEHERLDKFGNWLEEGAKEAEVEDQTSTKQVVVEHE